MPVSTALDGHPRPPCAELLGWEIVDARARRRLDPHPLRGAPGVPEPGRHIQGGFLAAMLDDTMGPAIFI